ncbi:MAG: VWA domain-containing protein, partial [Planctomycetes bacterium]|nr:VWA domain-containing protein [Planctomycetota bacterium]
MDDLLQLLARWRGIPVADGQELRFEFARFPTGGLGLLVLLGLALAVGFVVTVYRRDAHSRPRAVQLLLAGLRALAVAVVAAILLEPSLVAIQRQTRPGHVLLLVDSSQSMAQKDGWRKPQAQAAADGWRGLGVADLRAASRLDLVRALLGHGDGELVRTLAARNDVQLYAFAGALDQLPLLPAAATPTPPTPPTATATNGAPAPTAASPAPRVDLARLAADGRASNLGGALRTALDKSRNAEIAAVVFVTDGRRNAGPQAAEVARLLGQRKIPHVFALGVGDPSATQSVQLARFEAPAKVFQRDPFEAKATVFAQGYDAAVATLRLLRVDDKGQEQVVRTQQVALAGDGETAVEWKDLVADAPGRFTYRAEVAPPDGEPLVPERHARTAPVEVLGERLRLLLVAGGASHEFQILRNLLLRDKTIDVACWLQSADPKFPQDGDDGARIERLPEERAEFDPYDVVVLLDPDASKLT